MKKKLMYEVPDAEQIELKLESYLMQSGNGWDSPATESSSWGGDNDDNGME